MYYTSMKNPNYDQKKIYEKTDSVVSQIYFFLILGWIGQIIGLSVEKISVSGAMFVIKNNHAFPGVIFIICILLYAKLMAMTTYYFVFAGLDDKFLIKKMFKQAIIQTRKEKKYTNPIKRAKNLAKSSIIFWKSFGAFVIFFPLIYIILFEYQSVYNTIMGASK